MVGQRSIFLRVTWWPPSYGIFIGLHFWPCTCAAYMYHRDSPWAGTHRCLVLLFACQSNSTAVGFSIVISVVTPLSRLFCHFWQSPNDSGFVVNGSHPMAVSYWKHVWTYNPRCRPMWGATLWQFHRVADSCTCSYRRTCAPPMPATTL